MKLNHTSKNHSIFFLFIFCLFSNFTSYSQSMCPTCEVILPDSLQEDTFFLQEVSDGEFRKPFDANVAFRLPTNTTQIQFLVPSVPSGININELRIKSINNLPAGLSWEANQNNYNLPDERDGCIRICGTPFQFGTFEIDITVEAQVAIISQEATFSRTLVILPPETSNNGFSMINNIGCGDTEVSFINNNPSNGGAGFEYRWDFGLGSSTIDENPLPQTYTVPGVYPVSYTAIIDTIGFILTEIEVQALSCDDLFGRPDIKLRITDPQDSIVFENESIDNTEPPLRFPFNFAILDGNYTLEVIDDDSGLAGGDDICGTINFNQLSNGILEDGDLRVALSIFHPIDTVTAQDSVIVFSNPTIPIIDFDDTNPFCEGDTLFLDAVSDEATQFQWFQDSTLVNEAIQARFGITELGQYAVSIINENGCLSTSIPVSITPSPLPSPPVLKQQSNLLSIFDPSILPEDHSYRWFQEDNLLENSDFNLCIFETSSYRVELIDNSTGCSNSFEGVYSFDENGVCTTSAEDLSAQIEEIRIFPNPVTTHLNIELDLNERLETSTYISIINTLGNTLFSQEINQSELSQQWQFNISDYPSGLYFIQITDGRKANTWKIMKR